MTFNIVEEFGSSSIFSGDLFYIVVVEVVVVVVSTI